MKKTTMAWHIFQPATSAITPAPFLANTDVFSPTAAPVALKTNDEAALAAEDLAALCEQGLSEESIEIIADAVNEELSSNANADAGIIDAAADNDAKESAAPDALDTSIKTKHSAKVHTSKNDAIYQDEQHEKSQESQYELFKQYLAKKNNENQIDYRQVRLDIESSALPTRTYYLMNALAATIAGFGLLQNSPAVVIGAMMVAMLMGPISGIALATIDARFALLKKSLISLLSGGLLIYAIGMLLGWLYPDSANSQEIISRTSPNTMDVIIALAGGIAGAYSLIMPKLSTAVTGVAVATALVPPLTASGILLANGQYTLALGAFVLTLTNILAIQLTNALVLWFAGFRRMDRAEACDEKLNKANGRQLLLFMKRNFISVVMLLVLSIYLGVNFRHNLKEQRYESAVRQVVAQHIDAKHSELVSTEFQQVQHKVAIAQKSAQYVVEVRIQGLDAPSLADVNAMQDEINQLTEARFGDNRQTKLQLRFIPEQVIQAQ